jgi:hypothetical protein
MPDELPRLDPDTAETSPEPMEEILEYLGMEADEEIAVDALRFVRTAKVEGRDYWIWEFDDADENQCYVTVSRGADGRTMIGYDVNYDNLTPEQFMSDEAQGLR